jgi:hypothetical protein
MNGPTRTQTYTGVTQLESQAMADADAAEAAQHGWYAVSGKWNGTQLIVTFAQTGVSPWAQPVALPTAPAPKKKRRPSRRVVSAIAVGMMVFLVVVARGPNAHRRAA